MFSAIAPTYDRLNHILSLNVDRSWRDKALARLEWEARPDGRYLDACAGTLDFAAALLAKPAFRGTVVGADFALPMLKLGGAKAGGRVLRAGSDALQFPFADQTFDGAFVGFGVRNLADLDAGVAELRRVLRDGRGSSSWTSPRRRSRRCARCISSISGAFCRWRVAWCPGTRRHTRTCPRRCWRSRRPRRCGSGWNGRVSGTAVGVS